MLVLSFAAGTQLFVEPTVLGYGDTGVDQQVLVAEPTRLVRRIPVRPVQRSRRDLGRPARDRPRRRGGAGLAQEDCSRSSDGVASSLRDSLRRSGRSCSFFTAFFFVPIIWLFLAPTKTDGQLLAESPFAFGSLSTLAHTFHRIVTYGGNSMPDLAEELSDLLVRRDSPGHPGGDPGRVRAGADAVHRAADYCWRSRSS